MTGLECLKEEMIKRGCNNSQLNSKMLPIVLDIVANSGTLYAQIDKQLDEKAKLEHDILILQDKYERLQRQFNDTRLLLERQTELFNRNILNYVSEFQECINGCETPEKRDAIKTAQVFIESVDVSTKYDNTAFIIGLATILSNAKLQGIEELRKLNGKIPKAIFDNAGRVTVTYDEYKVVPYKRTLKAY